MLLSHLMQGVRPSRTVPAWLERNEESLRMSKVRPDHYWNVPLADWQQRSTKVLKQVAKALLGTFYVAVDKKHIAKNSSAKKPLPPAKWKAVGKAFATCQHSSRQRRRTSL